MHKTSHYTGRFAPSPTGPLHFGSLVTAAGSYLDARANNGKWLVRMEDLDPPRCVAGADSDILHTLEDYGMYWDDTVMYQSQRNPAYEDALQELKRHGHVYDCGCSRKEIADIAEAGIDGPVYPGTCRNGLPDNTEARGIRVRTRDEDFVLHDLLQGELRQNLEQQVGDFIVRRADGLFAYQLAVVVDDAEQQVTDIVRGSDLLDSTPRQAWLHQLMGYPVPHYMHLPIATNKQGQKLSKQTNALAVDRNDPMVTLHKVMLFLGQPISHDMQGMTLSEFWDEAVRQWQPGNIPHARQQYLPLD